MISLTKISPKCICSNIISIVKSEITKFQARFAKTQEKLFPNFTKNTI